MPNFIKEILIGTYGSKGKQTISLAYPLIPAEPYCITAICGKNNTGKTHILREVSLSLDNALHNEAEKESLNIHAVLLHPKDPPPRLLHLEDLTSDKRRIAQIPIGQYKHDPGGNTPNLREASVTFSGKHLLSRFGCSADLSKWIADADFRRQFCSNHFTDRTIYACIPEDPVVRRIEDATGARLYIGEKGPGRTAHLELALRYDEHRVFYYPSWSDGQKALFCAILAISHHHPEVVLLDEIENHFHPEFITQLALFLKEMVPQTVLVTHHPHVLFSELVDRLHYVELEADRPEEMPETQQLPGGFRPRSPRRRIRVLENDFEIISAAYGLFHNQDRQLLSLAQTTLDAVEVTFTEQILTAFQPDVRPAAAGPFSDAQTKQLLEVLKTIAQNAGGQGLQILDYGAGRGRTLRELLKYTSVRRGFAMQWVLWDPDEGRQHELRELVQGLEIPGIKVLAGPEEIVPYSFDVAILANVLHEVTPLAFGSIFRALGRALKTTTRSIVILELVID